MSRIQPMPNWWDNFFDDEYAAYGLACTPPDELKRIVDFLVEALHLSAGQTVFDQCCGIGRISLPLAERGLKIIGVDQSRPYVELIRQESSRRRLPCEVHLGDAFEFVTPRLCDAAINWFTSFGYCEDDALNVRMFQRVAESLRPGGWFALDYLNTSRVFADFKASHIERPDDPHFHGLVVMTEVKPDFGTGMLDCLWTFLRSDGSRSERHITTRMYAPRDVKALLERCGFVDIQLLGGVDGKPLERLSQRLVIICRKSP